jgi:PEP-CTERM motif-containing protein
VSLPSAKKRFFSVTLPPQWHEQFAAKIWISRGNIMQRIFLAPATLLSATLLATYVLPARASVVDSVDPVFMTLDAFAFAFPGPPPGSNAGCGGSFPACPLTLPQSADALQIGNGSSASAGVTISSFPAILVTANTVWGPTVPPGGPTIASEAQSSGSLTFYFELFPVPGTNFEGDVPVLMDGSSKMTFKGSEGTASTSVNMNVEVVTTSDAIYTLPSDHQGQFLQTLTIEPGVEYKVNMSASASASQTASAMASIDPFLSISPSCDCAGDFNLVLSDGITNDAPTVPEPATWTLMLLGFAGLGTTALYRRRTFLTPLAKAG